MSNLWKLIAVAIGAALVACQWTPPHSTALEEARRAFKMARADPLVAHAAETELHEAQVALRRAEHAWIETHDDDATSHLAYVAFQRVAIARNVGLQREAEQRLQRAELEGRSRLASESEGGAAQVTAAHAVTVNLQQAPPAGGPVQGESAEATAQASPAPAATEPVRMLPDAAAPLRRVQPTPAAAPALPQRIQTRATTTIPSQGAVSRQARALPVHRPSPRAATRLASGNKVAAVTQQRAPGLGKAPVDPPREALVSRPEVWYLEAQGRPFVVPPLNPSSEARLLAPLRRSQWLSSSGRTQPVSN